MSYNDQQKNLNLLVTEGNVPSLMGRDWLQHLRLDWPRFFQVNSVQHTYQEILERHPTVFKDEMGCIKGTLVNPDAAPKFYKARSVTYSLKTKVEAELDCLEQAQILELVQFSNWAAPIVPVVKRDGSIRICGDYKLTVNQVEQTDTHPLPRI